MYVDGEGVTSAFVAAALATGLAVEITFVQGVPQVRLLSRRDQVAELDTLGDRLLDLVFPSERGAVRAGRPWLDLRPPSERGTTDQVPRSTERPPQSGFLTNRDLTRMGVTNADRTA